MKRIMPFFGVALTLVTSLALGHDIPQPEALAAAEDRALVSFKDDKTLGCFYDAINGFVVDASQDGSKALIKVTYKDGEEQKEKNYELDVEHEDLQEIDLKGYVIPRAWGVKELLISRNYAIGVARDHLGAEQYETIKSITVAKIGSLGNRARVRFVYVSNDPKTLGQDKVKSYGCHEHEHDGETHIDCH